MAYQAYSTIHANSLPTLSTSDNTHQDVPYCFHLDTILLHELSNDESDKSFHYKVQNRLDADFSIGLHIYPLHVYHNRLHISTHLPDLLHLHLLSTNKACPVQSHRIRLLLPVLKLYYSPPQPTHRQEHHIYEEDQSRLYGQPGIHSHIPCRHPPYVPYTV